MTPIAEMLNSRSGISLTPKITIGIRRRAASMTWRTRCSSTRCSTCKRRVRRGNRRSGFQARRCEHPRRGHHRADRSRSRCRRRAGPLATHRAGCGHRPARRAKNTAANRSASAMTHRCVFAEGMRGMIDASIWDRQPAEAEDTSIRIDDRSIAGRALRYGRSRLGGGTSRRSGGAGRRRLDSARNAGRQRAVPVRASAISSRPAATATSRSPSDSEPSHREAPAGPADRALGGRTLPRRPRASATWTFRSVNRWPPSTMPVYGITWNRRGSPSTSALRSAAPGSTARPGGRIRVDPESVADLRVVLHPPPDRRELMRDGDAVLERSPRRSDADLRRQAGLDVGRRGR